MISRIEKYHNRRKPFHRVTARMEQIPTKILVIIGVHIVILFLTLLIGDLEYHAKVSLFGFLSAMTLWVTTKLSAGFIAISMIAFIIILNAAEPELLYYSLSEEVVWLMVGAFIIGAALKESGLAERLTLFILNKATKKNHILYGVSSILFASVFFVPSTSGRAALSMPILHQLRKNFTSREQSFLAMLAPVIILISTSATIIGAGSHLIGIGLLESTVDQSISFFQWMIWGLPFTIVMTVLSFFVLKQMLWPKDSIKDINMQTSQDLPSKKPMSGKEKKTLIIMICLIAGWMTESLHGYDIAFITMVGAILVMTPNYGIIDWKQGMKSVSWNLIMFVAAATALGKVLVDTGVVQWMEGNMLGLLHIFVDAPEWIIVLIILLVTVTSHLYITSHTTRAIVFIPSLLLFSETIGVNPATVVFLSLVGLNYCVTFPVSSKALLLFYEEGEISYDASNLLKVSAVLMPLYIIVMLIFYFTFWNWTGMEL